MTEKNQRINLRSDERSVELLREAAELQGQDLTSFMMSASLDRARQVIAEDRVLRLDPTEILQVERTLDREAVEVPQLRRLLNGARQRADA